MGLALHESHTLIQIQFQEVPLESSQAVSLALSILESLTATLTKAALVKASVNFGACWFSGQNRE